MRLTDEERAVFRKLGKYAARIKREKSDRSILSLTASEIDYCLYLRRRTPKINSKELKYLQGDVCVVCGNVRSKKQLDSKEHLIPVSWSVRKNRRLKQWINSPLNIGLAHSSCNFSRGDTPLIDYWKRYPKFEAPAKLAIAGLLSALRVVKKKDIPLMREILRQTGMLVHSDRER